MRVVVVDDDQGCLLVAQAAVQQSGTNAVASDGGTARDLYCTPLPHVVVIDLEVPGREGSSLCRAIRAAEAKSGYTYLVLVHRTGPATPSRQAWLQAPMTMSQAAGPSLFPTSPRARSRPSTGQARRPRWPR